MTSSPASNLPDPVSDLQDTLEEVLERETADEVADLNWQLQKTRRDLQRLREENAYRVTEVATLMSNPSRLIRCKGGLVRYDCPMVASPPAMNETPR
ncbi:light-regulated signal transduction histidine kinase (bacteriophytochrome) [Skermanella aerolata]|uniref:hypothetical protein n=1 Tax=Skermanella aerolata TaxID=393310 RepID=UPI003D19211C